MSPICRSDIMANFPFTRRTLAVEGKQAGGGGGGGGVVVGGGAGGGTLKKVIYYISNRSVSLVIV